MKTCCGVAASTSPNQLAATDRPIPTPKASPRSWTSALAVFATPDWRCCAASSRMPVVSVIPGRKVTMAASVTMSGGRVEAEPAQRCGAEAGRDRRDRSDHRLEASRSCGRQRDRPDDESYPSCALRPHATRRRAPASAPPPLLRRRQASSATCRSSGVASMSASAASACSGPSRSSSTAPTRSSRRAISVQVDGRGLDTQCVGCAGSEAIPSDDLDARSGSQRPAPLRARAEDASARMRSSRSAVG